MKVLICTGDSHTWGQGARGIVTEDMPSLYGAEGVCAGELRPVPFDRNECYVARLRDELCGEAREYKAETLAEQSGLALSDGCAVVRGELSVRVTGGLFRVFFKKTKGGARASVELDGCAVWEGGLETEEPAWNGTGVKAVCARCEDGAHELTVRSSEAFVYRIEAYSGEWAVVNAGVGSCSAREYLDTYWKDYVEACRPDAVLAEAHSINDWLRPLPAAQSEEALTEMIDRCRRLGAEPFIMTVSPIMGRQTNDLSPDVYDRYIEASRSAAKKTGACLVDANAAMAGLMAGLDENTRRALLYSDDWHVNSLGHMIYARLALCALEKKSD